jgi:hypothetical protein
MAGRSGLGNLPPMEIDESDERADILSAGKIALTYAFDSIQLLLDTKVKGQQGTGRIGSDDYVLPWRRVPSNLHTRDLLMNTTWRGSVALPVLECQHRCKSDIIRISLGRIVQYPIPILSYRSQS